MQSSPVFGPHTTDEEILEEFERERAKLRESGLFFENYQKYEEQLEEVYGVCFTRLRGFSRHREKPKAEPPKMREPVIARLHAVPGYIHLEVLGILQKSQKAVLFRMEGGSRKWFPRSVIDGRFLQDHHILLVKDWFAQKEGIV